MSNNFEDFCNANTPDQRICSVAYTLNNSQPVLCTHIGDQPLFYIDEECIDDEDDALFDHEDFAHIAEEIRQLKHEILAHEKAALFLNDKSAELMNAFAENAESMTDDRSLTFNERKSRIDYLKEVLSKSRVAAAYLNVAEKHNIDILLSDQIEFSFYDRRSGTILINATQCYTDQLLLLAKELRRHWQHRQGALLNPLLFQPEHCILIHRAQEADLATSMVRTAWELQLAGFKDAWERLENSPMADLTRAFARDAYLDFRSINNGVAAAAVFEAWFLSDRSRGQDKKIVQAMLADYKGYVFENESISQNVTVELISALGSVPFGKNYLAQHATTILEDPIFGEVRDRSNANFLWFIKFERSCKETERDLQVSADLSTSGDRLDVYTQGSQDQSHELQKSADIVQLYEYRSEEDGERKPGTLLSKNRASAQIIDLEKWSANR